MGLKLYDWNKGSHTNMADSMRIDVAKLNNENYQIWKYKIELLLIKEGLLSVIIEEPPHHRIQNG